jgi:hypothetical protein
LDTKVLKALAEEYSPQTLAEYSPDGKKVSFIHKNDLYVKDLLTEKISPITTDGKRNVLVSANPVSIDPSMGFELIYNKIIFLRAGVGNAQRVSPIGDEAGWTVQPNMGLGLKIRNLQIDYALSDIGNVSDVLYSNVFSLRIDLVKKK